MLDEGDEVVRRQQPLLLNHDVARQLPMTGIHGLYWTIYAAVNFRILIGIQPQLFNKSGSG